MTHNERELGSTERGFLLCFYLLQERMSTSQVASKLGYRGYSGAANLLYRLRAEGLIRDDDGLWYVVTKEE